MTHINSLEKEKLITNRWQLKDGGSILWDITKDPCLPHEDFLEMSGRKVSMIVHYGVDREGSLTLSRKIIWPALRTIPNDTNASLSQYYTQESAPQIHMDNTLVSAEKPYCIELDGVLTIKSIAAEKLEIIRTIFPSFQNSASIELIKLTNVCGEEVHIDIKHADNTIIARGCHGIYMLEVICDTKNKSTKVSPGEVLCFSVIYNGRKLMNSLEELDAYKELKIRREFVYGLNSSLRLETPDPVLNREFDFSKIRAAESIFKTKCGLVHSPGGEAYYAAVWANDEAEYAGPFFPFLGDDGGNEASLNCYRLYRPFMGPDFRAIPSSIIAEGEDIWEGAGDRGDAAMYAYGASRYALALGDKKIAEELWFGIEWCLEYCFRKMTVDGVIASDHDELEGRFPCGKTNLSTSSLTYGALCSAANLARELGKTDIAKTYTQRASKLEEAIEVFFGRSMEGFETYRYYEENEVLRSWICIPLTMGITRRTEGTAAALFSPRLWTCGSMVTQAGDQTVWDRSALYAFRGVFAAGKVDEVLPYLKEYTQSRLLGEHVPYPIEAYPEGNRRHLSAEAALYCRVYIEGLFGITPTGLKSFTCLPRLPIEWDRMALRSIKAFNREFDVILERYESKLKIVVIVLGTNRSEYFCSPNEAVEIMLP